MATELTHPKTEDQQYPDALFNLEAEQAVLGALMANNQAMAHATFLRGGHFYAALHQRIFKACVEAWRSGKLFSPITLKTQFSADTMLKDHGGDTYLARLVGAATSIVNVHDYCKTITGLAQRRALYEACQDATQTIKSGVGLDPMEAALTLAQKFQDVSIGFNAPVFQDDYEIVEKILNNIEKDFRPYPTGITGLDRSMEGGLYPGKSYGFAARKKMGKTILAGTISCNLNIAGVRHLFICGEMSPEEIQQRTMARLLQVYPSIFRNRREQSTDFLTRVAAAASDSKRCIIYKNAPGLSFDDLKRIVLLAKVQKKVTGFILDYWQLVGGKDRGRSTSEHQDEVAQWIADICRQYDLWAIVMAQINQDGNTRGGEGLRLSFDQVYQLNSNDEDNDPSATGRWLQMMDTRYTQWADVGSKDKPGFYLKVKGPYFEEEAPGLPL